MNTDNMVSFGGKQAWLAIRDSDQDAVLAALDLRDLGAVSWRDGLDVAHLTDDRIAVTPPLTGARGETWVLAAGRRLLRPDAGLDVTELSRRLGTEVQFFATHRVTETHRWQRAAAGELIRAFGYVGQTGDVTSWFGDPDAAERAVGLPAAIAPPAQDEPAGPLDLDEELAALLADADAEEVTVLVSEQDVLRVAGSWSLDPSQLTGRAPGPLRVGAVVADREDD